MSILHPAVKFWQAHPIICLFVICFIVFNLNFRPVPSADTVTARLIPFSILDTGTLYLDNFIDGKDTGASLINITASSYFVTRVNSHYLSIFPVVVPALVTPLYVPVYLLLEVLNVPLSVNDATFSIASSVLEKVCASLISALSVVFIYMAARKMFNDRVALVTAFVYAFATGVWSTGSQALWQHGMVQLLLSVSLFLLISYEKEPCDWKMLAMGAMAGLIFFCRPVDAILVSPVIIYVLIKGIKKALAFIVAAIAAGLPFAIYNVYYFGSIFGWYDYNLSVMDPFNDHLINAFLAMLISPGRGIFVLSPILIFAIIGFFMILTDKKYGIDVRNSLSLILPAFIINVLLYASFTAWWGGWSYGYRYLSGSLPLFAICLAAFINYMLLLKPGKARKGIAIVFAALLLMSVFVQVVGVFYYPNGDWDGQPDIDRHPEKVWQINDTQVVRTFNGGIFNPFTVLINKINNGT